MLVLPGIVLAYIMGFPLILAPSRRDGTTLATGYLAQNSRVKRDTVMGVVFAGMFGLGIVLLPLGKPRTSIWIMLFRQYAGGQAHDLWTAG